VSAADLIRFSRRDLLASVTSARTRQTDAQLLSSLAELEQLAIAVDELALRSRRLTAATHALVSAISTQERAHAAALSRWPGVEPAPPIGPGKDFAAALSAAGIDLEHRRLRTDRDWLAALASVETTLEGAYYAALGQLASPAAASLAATILANEAQHRTLLSRQRYPRVIEFAVPSGLVQGTPPPAPEDRPD
jgi:hypothetical protein